MFLSQTPNNGVGERVAQQLRALLGSILSTHISLTTLFTLTFRRFKVLFWSPRAVGHKYSQAHRDKSKLKKKKQQKNPSHKQWKNHFLKNLFKEHKMHLNIFFVLF